MYDMMSFTSPVCMGIYIEKAVRKVSNKDFLYWDFKVLKFSYPYFPSCVKVIITHYLYNIRGNNKNYSYFGGKKVLPSFDSS